MLSPIPLSMYSTKGLYLEPLIEKPESEIIEDLKKLIEKSMDFPDKFGIMFSGGIDSTLIAHLTKKANKDFICYTVSVGESKDLQAAKQIAEEYNFPLKIIGVDVERCIPKVIDIINDTNIVKVSVGIVTYAVCEQAKKDGINILYGGLGAEDIFAGYKRHKDSNSINQECLNGLKIIYEKDISRDESIAKTFDVTLKAPYLNRKLVEYSLRIPGELKIDKNNNKNILRKTAEYFGIKEKYCQRKKVAAQYGSNVDKEIEKLAKEYPTKEDYLKSYVKDIKLGALVSGGKDSWLALWLMHKRGYNISCLLNIDSENKESYMFHTARIDLVKDQAKQSKIPLIVHKTKGVKEEELKELKELIQKAIDEHSIQGITTGALYSDYQRERVEKICEELNIKCISPLWHMDQEEELKLLLKENFEVAIVHTAADRLDDTWIGRVLDNKTIEELKQLNKKVELNIAAEGGEYETMVLNMPMFKEKLSLQ